MGFERMEPTLKRKAAAVAAAPVRDAAPRRRVVRRTLDGHLLQTKLVVGAAADPYEREADGVADQVVRALRSPERTERHENGSVEADAPQVVARRVQRMATIGPEGGAVDTETDREINAARGGGSPLAAQDRSRMESTIGADFSGVRIHEGSKAQRLNESLSAKAFTVGSDVFFRDGKPDTSTTAGQHLLAHELTHTVQQGAAVRTKRADDRGFDATGSASTTRIRRRTESVQRVLDLQNTNWTGATDVRASDGGMGGVLFVTDGSKSLVVKPGVRGAEEEISGFLHGEVSKGNKKGEFGVANLPRRVATAADVQGLQARILQLNPGLDLTDQNNRLVRLRSELAAGTTLIQERAGGGSKSMSQAMTDQAENGGHLEKKDKAKDSSPLKALLNQPSLAKVLGRAAAMDIFTGNRDRIIGKANLENFLINTKTKSISLIDNVGGDAAEGFDVGGDGRADFDVWEADPAVALLASSQFDVLSRATWNTIEMSGPDVDQTAAGTQISVMDDIIEGGRYDSGKKKRLNNVPTAQQPAVKDKMYKKNAKHIQAIVKNFSIGLAEGRAAIIKTNGILPLNVSDTAKRMFCARYVRIFGLSANLAWQTALQAHPLPVPVPVVAPVMPPVLPPVPVGGLPPLPNVPAPRQRRNLIGNNR